jgi:hypothetical protein
MHVGDRDAARQETGFRLPVTFLRVLADNDGPAVRTHIHAPAAI